MDDLTCAVARRRLPAFHDEELPLVERREVAAHLAWCCDCAAEAAALRQLGGALRAAAAHCGPDDVAGLCASVIGRLSAEREQTLGARVSRLFEDMHLVWAGLIAAAGTAASVLIMAGLVYFGASVRADSLSGILAALASPGSNVNPVQPYSGVVLPRVYPDGVSAAMVDPGGTDEDLMLVLSAVVTREGRVTELELLRASDQDRAVILGLLHAASAARFEPARFRQAPVAVNLIWLLAHTTVRGSV